VQCPAKYLFRLVTRRHIIVHWYDRTGHTDEPTVELSNIRRDMLVFAFEFVEGKWEAPRSKANKRRERTHSLQSPAPN
jgi:hypothetical protein